jgi:hypothetical protein
MRSNNVQIRNGSDSRFEAGTGGDVDVPPLRENTTPLDRARVLAALQAHRLVHRSLERHWQTSPLTAGMPEEMRAFQVALHGGIADATNAVMAEIVAGRCDCAPPASLPRRAPALPPGTPLDPDLEAAIRRVEALGRKMLAEREGERLAATRDTWHCRRHQDPDTVARCDGCGTGGCRS